MRLRLAPPLILVLALFATDQNSASDLPLVGAKIYLSPTEPLIENGSILVHGAHIVSVGPSTEMKHVGLSQIRYTIRSGQIVYRER
jgi:hypothetical protein